MNIDFLISTTPFIGNFVLLQAGLAYGLMNYQPENSYAIAYSGHFQPLVYAYVYSFNVYSFFLVDLLFFKKRLHSFPKIFLNFL